MSDGFRHAKTFATPPMHGGRTCWPDGHTPPVMDHVAGANRLACEMATIRAMLDHATPPDAMRAAPVAPARGPQTLQVEYEMQRGGTRRLVGAHFRDKCALERMVTKAWDRHTSRGIEAAFVAPFSPSQIAVARDYRALCEWREVSALRCASLEAGRGGGGSGMFIDTFIDQGWWLDRLRARIGMAVALDVRRHMDRGNARHSVSVRAAVDMLVLGGQDVSTILRRFGWEADGKNRKTLRLSICGALDRMQGYRG